MKPTNKVVNMFKPKSGFKQQLFLPGFEPVCICPKECDCENPEPKEGVALVSDHCPIHNEHPAPTPYPDCPVHGDDPS